MLQVQCRCPSCRTVLSLAGTPGTMPLVRCRACGATFRVNVPTSPPAGSASQPRPAPRPATRTRPAARRLVRPPVEDDAPAPDRTRLALFGVAVGVVLLLVGGLGLALFLASGEKGRPVAQAADE